MPKPSYQKDFYLNIDDLPLIVGGPILRRTEQDAVTVWLALKEPRLVTLRVYSTEEGKGAELDKLLLEGRQTTVQLGRHLHLVAVTAQPIENVRLKSGQIYAYDMLLGESQEHIVTALNSQDLNATISYFSHQLPTFSLPPDDLDRLRIVHGSCRKPHGGELDLLPCLDFLIQQSAHLPDERPHQLFLTGDQIYGDDVADPFLWAASAVGKALLGWEENLPLQQGHVEASQLKPGQRSKIAEVEGGFTAMLHGKSAKAKSHLFSFGEYAAIYLFAWSSVLLLHNFPSGKTLCPNRKSARRWEKEVSAIKDFTITLWQVRRALANVPTYTICDDHDISDDWYLNREWCDRVLSKPLGRRVIQNGLLAYALFQAWGNTPEQFADGQPGAKLLSAVEKWSAAEGTDAFAWEEIARYLGIPPINSETGLPELESDEDVLVLVRDAEALRWHYHLRTSKHEVIVLDTRTWRGYPTKSNKDTAPPMLLSPTALTRQLQTPLEQTDKLEPDGKGKIEATIVVIPTNLVTLSLIDLIQRFSLKGDRVFSNDVGDSWNFNKEAFNKLLLCLCQRRERVVIISGDIHYSCAVRISHWFRFPTQASVLVQLTSSAIKNSELSTRLVHTKIKSLFPEPTENWVGWQEPLRLVKLPHRHSYWRQLFPWHSNKQKPWQTEIGDEQSPPDWQYRIEWIKREKAHSLNWEEQPSSVKSRFTFWQQITRSLVSWLWRNRWLQEGKEVVGRNNLSVVRLQQFQQGTDPAVIQETYWHPPWKSTSTVKSRYFVSLNSDLPSSESKL
ncbi:PhoD-like phosphatase [Pleurocapsales cyanobacterium LEGE 06147]|nr:PhoD-like phosphatase [Pleurocapsales cyanobacterium LEGE 06147]